MALHAEPAGLDPHFQSESVANAILGNVYEPLVTFDSEMAILPRLALRWETIDDLTWVFHLRPGVRFHDGRPLLAEDVVASLERARTHPGSQTSSYLVAVERVWSDDPGTVAVRTRQPYPILLNKLAFIWVVPSEVDEEVTEPLGTGPYRFAGWDGNDALAFEVFPEYWGPPPSVPRLLFAFAPDPEERLRLLLAGQVDLINQVPPEAAARLEGAAGVRLEVRDGLRVVYLHARPDVPPFDDRRVREAIHLGIDRAALVAENLAGLGRPAGQMVTSQVFGYVPGIEAPPPRPERARELLAEAGLSPGTQVELELRAGREVAGLVEQLRGIGLQVELRPQPWSDMYPRLTTGRVPFYLGGWINNSADASDFFDHKAHTPDSVRGYGTSNTAGYSRPEVDRLIEASGSTLAMSERLSLLAEASRAVLADLAYIPLYEPFDLYGLRSTLVWRPRLDVRVLGEEMSWAEEE